MGNESVPKIILSDTLIFKTAMSVLVISNHNSFRVLSDKLASVYFLFEKYIYILALEMANQLPIVPTVSARVHSVLVSYNTRGMACWLLELLINPADRQTDRQTEHDIRACDDKLA